MTTLNSRKLPSPLIRTLMSLMGVFLLIQLIPYGHSHTNPAIQANPTWDSPATEIVFKRACADCHSNTTVWPWYSNIAPVSWLVRRHVDEGRSKFNINTIGFGEEAHKAAEEVRSGGMPEPTYLLMHPEARLNSIEKEQLAAGLEATFDTTKQTEKKTDSGAINAKPAVAPSSIPSENEDGEGN